MKILSCLDLTERDYDIIKYTVSIAKIFEAEEIIFLHIQGEIPDEIKPKFINLVSSTKEYISTEVDKAYPGLQREFHYNIIVDEGEPTKEILRIAVVKDVDFVVIGSKKERYRVLPQRIVRHSPASVLVVPYMREIKKILIPIDFSEHSKLAVSVARKIMERTKAKAILQHVYSIPPLKYELVMKFDEIKNLVKEKAEDRMKKFLEEIGGNDFSYVLSFDREDSPPKETMALAEEEQVDLVIIGSKGKTSAAAMLLGSFAEKFVSNLKTPTLVVKKKGESLGVIKALFT